MLPGRLPRAERDREGSLSGGGGLVLRWDSMTNDTKWIIGTVIVLAGLLATQFAAQFAGVNTRIDDVRTDLTAQIAGLDARIDDVSARMDRIETRMDRIETRMDRIEIRLDRFDDRLRSVEIAFGKVDQRLLTLERVILPVPERDE